MLSTTSLVNQIQRGYQFKELIGEGGFGVVYRANQPSVGREVAIKIILPEYANHPDFIRRFEVEAHLIARLEHPFIVPLYDYWREPDSAYLVMRFLRGGNLRGAVRKGALTTDFVDRSLSQIATALTVAHNAGVIHRDIKPDNILLDEQGNSYLTDFGIAKDLSEGSITEAESMIGSYAYISPEQAKGLTINTQADIYCLGIVLFELLAGVHPFAGAAIGPMLSKHMNESLPDIRQFRPDLPEAVNVVIQRATAKDPDSRYTHSVDLAFAFRQALQGKVRRTNISAEDMTPDPGMTNIIQALVETGGLSMSMGVAPSTDTGLLLPEINNPYRGLRAFEEADAAQFFGREKTIERLLAHFAATSPWRLLALVGPSGSGKSSVVRAGVIPNLRRNAIPGSRNWYIQEFFPGVRPFEELEASLLRIAINPPDSLLQQLQEDERGILRAVKRVVPEDSILLLLIDQGEELFTLTENEAMCNRFLEGLYTALADPRTPLRVIMTIRTDFYGYFLQHPTFGELMRRCTEVIQPMTPDELRQAVTGPAEMIGLYFEPGLLDAIMADVQQQPGALPMVEFALTELFERREKRRLTLASYQASGGVSGALARRAEELYAEFDPAQQQATRQLFLRLVTLGEGAEDTRRRVPITEMTASVALGNDDTMRYVIELYGSYRLLTFDNDPITRAPTVEVAHEALIREWGRMRDWLQASREDLRVQRRVSMAAAEWLKADRDRSFLASGARLEQIQTFAAHTDLMLTPEERSFIDASITEFEAQQSREKARLAHEDALERRSRNALRILAGVFASATVLALILSGFAFTQRQSAQENAGTATVALGQVQIEANISKTQVSIAATSAAFAQARELEAERNAEEANSLTLSTNAQRALSINAPDLALALALEANRIKDPPTQVERILFETAFAPGVRRVMDGQRGTVRAVAYDPTGKFALSGGDDAALIYWDIEKGVRLRSFGEHPGAVWTVAISPDGLYGLSGNGRPRLVQAEPILTDNTIRLWDLKTGRELRRFSGHTDAITSAVFSPNGEYILSASADKSLMLWQTASGALVRAFDTRHTDAVLSVQFGADGKTAVSGGADRSVILWDVATGKPIKQFSGHAAQVNTVALSPSQKLIVSGAGTSFSRGEDFALIVWDVTSGDELRRLRGHTAPITGLAFNPDGRTALSTSSDKVMILWDVATGKEIRRYLSDSAIQSVAFNPTRHEAITGGMDKRVLVWDTESSAEIGRFLGHGGPVNGVALSPDGQYAASASTDSVVILWDAKTGRLIRRLFTHNQAVLSVAFSPDSRQLVSASADKTLIIWDVQTGALLKRLRGHIDRVNRAIFSPDGKQVLSGAGEGNLILWDAGSGLEVRRLLGHVGAILSVAYHPNGTQAASGSVDKTLIMWDVATGKALRILKAHTDRVNSVAYSADGKLMLSGGGDGLLILWDGVGGQEVRRFSVGRAVLSAQFSPDDRYITAALNDGSLIVVEASTGDVVQHLYGHTLAANSITYAGDGATLLSGSSDGSLILWKALTPQTLVAWITANHYVRPLTCGERTQYRLALLPECR